MAKLIAGVVAVAFLLWCASVAFKNLGPGPVAVFEALLGDPSEVTDLDGFVRKGDDYDVQIRFKVEEDWVWAIRHRGFKPMDCESARRKINFSLMRIAAWPPWRPEEFVDADCYSRTGENEWSPNGRDVLLVDEESGWVYFAGTGREHDRAMPGTDDRYH